MSEYLRYNWKLSPENPFHVIEQDFPKGGRYPVLDVHQALHLNFILSGSICGRTGDEYFHSEAGDMILNPPWEIHGDNRISAGTQLYGITVAPEALPEAFPACGERLSAFFLRSPGERREVLDLPPVKSRIGTLVRQLRALESSDEELLKMKQWLMIQQLLAVLLEFLPAHRELAQDALRIAPAIKLLIPGRLVSLSDAAEVCGLGERRFSQLFRKVYRTSFSAYQQEQRLNRSAVNLRRGMPVKMAAAAENFYDTSYFVKCFTRKFGITPGKFGR